MALCNEAGTTRKTFYKYFDTVEDVLYSIIDKEIQASILFIENDAVEFTNEPNMLDMTGFPENYTAADYARDQDLFHKWVRDNYPETLIVGPCASEGALGNSEEKLVNS